MTDLKTKTPEELQAIIAEATEQLELLQRNKHKAVIAQIKELAASINVTVEIHEERKKSSTRAGEIIPAKYRNPNDSTKTWTGRGMTPNWLKKLITDGHDKSEYLIHD